MKSKQTRKTSQQIKEEILLKLSNEPLSVEQLLKSIEDSNWSTINKYLEELKEQKLVIEIISTGKIKIYQKITGDTYFDIPITEEQRKKFHTLFAMILEEYKNHGKTPTKTHMAKCAVYVIDNEEAELHDLPIVWYLYGMMPLMVINPIAQYSKENPLQKEKKIKELIVEFVIENGETKSSQLQKEQHRKYNEEMYVAIDNLFDTLNEPEFENKKIIRLLDEVFIACPAEENFIEVFDSTEKIISVIQKMNIIGLKLQDVRSKIIQSINCLWKFVALHKLCKSLSQGKNAMNKEILLNLYLKGSIEDRRALLEESLSELNSVYMNKLADFDVENITLSEDAKEIAKIMEDWTGEE